MITRRYLLRSISCSQENFKLVNASSTLIRSTCLAADLVWVFSVWNVWLRIRRVPAKKVSKVFNWNVLRISLTLRIYSDKAESAFNAWSSNSRNLKYQEMWFWLNGWALVVFMPGRFLATYWNSDILKSLQLHTLQFCHFSAKLSCFDNRPRNRPGMNIPWFVQIANWTCNATVSF